MAARLTDEPFTTIAERMTDADVELIGEALGFLFVKAPARRTEIEGLCQRTGLGITVD